MEIDISTFDNDGRMVTQVMGSSAGYDAYLAAHAAAPDKSAFNANYDVQPVRKVCKCGCVNVGRSVCKECGGLI